MEFAEVWLAIFLLVAGLGLVILEVFFPSSGLLGFLAACAIVASVAVGFRCDPKPAVGIVILLVAVFGVPVVLMTALNYLPRTAMGRKVLLMSPSSEEVLPDNPRTRSLKAMIGQVGRAKSKMLPGGVITVAGHTIDAISEGMPIEPGQPVRIIEVRANRVVVRPIADETPLGCEEDPLARPVDSVIPDPFDESTG
jgi:membrane-bound ClpP family serine protease